MRAWALIIASGLSSCIAGPAFAQSACAPAEVFTRGLEERYGELPFAQGELSDGRGVLLLASPETNSWTFLIEPQPGSGVLCGAAEGKGWRPVAPAPKGKPS